MEPGLVSKKARKELVGALRARYGQASKVEKGRILSEFAALSGYHRKHAIRLLTKTMAVTPGSDMLCTRVYDEAVKEALIVIWEAADRICGKIRKRYHQPATPCDRLLAHANVDGAVKDVLQGLRGQLDPVELLHRMRQGQSALAALSTGEPSSGPNRQNLDQLLSQLPQLWRQGEVRPTHRKTAIKAHYWRTREDPFNDVWTDILLWLQQNPDCAAKSIFHRLTEKYPDSFSAGQLRTLQRRIGEWRQTMARRLVFGGTEERNSAEVIAAKNSCAGEVSGT